MREKISTTRQRLDAGMHGVCVWRFPSKEVTFKFGARPKGTRKLITCLYPKLQNKSQNTLKNIQTIALVQAVRLAYLQSVAKSYPGVLYDCQSRPRRPYTYSTKRNTIVEGTIN